MKKNKHKEIGLGRTLKGHQAIRLVQSRIMSPYTRYLSHMLFTGAQCRGPTAFQGSSSQLFTYGYLTINSNPSLPWCCLSRLSLVLPAKDTEHIFLLATALGIFEDLHIACFPLSPLGFPRLSYFCTFRPLWQVMFWRSLSLFSSRPFPNRSLQIQRSRYTSGPPSLILCILQTGTWFITLNLLLFCNSNTLGHILKSSPQRRS